jgi:thymidylate kinase
MAGRIILVEGLDLAGKSTLVRNLAAELARRGIPVRVSRNALCPGNPIAALADQVRRDPQAGVLETGSLFLAAHLWDARHFASPPDGVIHLQDSCWLRTLAYNCDHGTPGIPDLLRAAIPSFPRFDAAVFLTAGIAERQRRLAQRECEQPGSNDAGNHLVRSNPQGFLRLEEMLWQLTTFYTQATRMETTNVPTERLVLGVVEMLTHARNEQGKA